MAIIPQSWLFNWEELDSLGDLERLVLLLESLPDEPLMKVLEKERGHGRNDYPIRGVWNSLLAGIVYQHRSIESLRRELLRNAQLRQVCGFDPCLGVAAVPSPDAYSDFFKKLYRHSRQVEGIFDELVRRLGEELPDFGTVLALDSKAIRSFARGRNEGPADGRRDTDADWGVKTYTHTDQQGRQEDRTRPWFGYKSHHLVDATYELPVAFPYVTTASASDIATARVWLETLARTHPHILKTAEALVADKGYDSTDLIKWLWQEHQIHPVIDIRDQWNAPGALRLVSGQGHVTYDYRGTVYCHCLETRTKRQMAFGGFEQDRGTLKYRCPAKHYDSRCACRDRCEISDSIRIPLASNPRVFTPIARSSYKWKRLYRQRTTVERVNSRMDVSFGFEEHTIRGLEKMRLRCGLAMIVMLGLAYGRVRQKQHVLMRSLVRLPEHVA